MTTPTVPGGPLKPDLRKASSLTVDGVELLNCPAWTVTDVRSLWAEAPQRGQDRIIPGAGGIIALPRHRTFRSTKLPIAIVGFVDRTGAANLDPWVGLETNISYLNTNVVRPASSSDGTRTMVLTMPSGTTLTGLVHVTAMEPKDAAGPVEVHELAVDIIDGRLF